VSLPVLLVQSGSVGSLPERHRRVRKGRRETIDGGTACLCPSR